MEDYEKIIDKNNGIIYANRLQEYKMDRHILRALVEKGILKRIEHGIYARPDKNINEFWLMGEKYKNGILSQTLIIHLIRTSKIPFVESKSSKQLLISTFAVVIITLIIAFSNISIIFDLSKLPYMYLLWIAILMIIYIVFIQVYKKIYIRSNKEWL